MPEKAASANATVEKADSAMTVLPRWRSRRPTLASIKHFEIYGINEGRKSSPSFNASSYKANNTNLASLQGIQLLEYPSPYFNFAGSQVYAENISLAAKSELENLDGKGIKIKDIAFAPNGGYVLLSGSNGYYTSGVSQEVINELSLLHNQGSIINSISFAPSKGFVILYDLNGFYPSSSIPQEAVNELNALNQQKQPIDSIAFSQNGGFAIISGYGVTGTTGLAGSNSYLSKSPLIPQNASTEIMNLQNHGIGIYSIAFAPNGDFLIVDTDFEHGRGVDSSNVFYYPGKINQLLNPVTTFSSVAFNVFSSVNSWAIVED